MAEFAERFGFDLANPLAGDAELAANLFERTLAAIIKSETEGDDAAFASRQRAKNAPDLIAQQRLRCLVNRREGVIVFNQIAKLPSCSSPIGAASDTGCRAARRA